MSRFSLVSRFSKLLAPALLLAAAGAAQASTYYVGSLGADAYGGSSPSYPFLTIQHAIDTASSGDTIFVLADTYTGTGNKDLDFGGKNLTLEALPYYGTATQVTLNLQGSGRGFYFHNGETNAAVVDSFNVINGNPGTGNYGGGAYITGSSSPTFIDTTFASNKASKGGAVYIYSSSPTFTGVTFNMNSALSDGGAISQVGSSSPIYTHSKFTTNKAGAYGGAVYAYSNDGTFYNDTFTGNTAPYGGAFYNYYYAYPTFYGGTFSKNTADYGGAFYSYYSIPSFYNTLITGNKVTSSGGAFYNYNSYPNFYNVTITGNIATSFGGAFYNDYNSSPHIEGSILWGNKVGVAESEIYDTDSTSSPYVYDTDIYGGWSGSGSYNLNTDPAFVSTTDFHLKSISPLIDQGGNYGYTLDDHDGNPRVCNFYTDLGAYERALPTAVNDTYSMSANTTLTVTKAAGVLANDLANKGGTLSAVLVTKPVYGILTLKSDGSFTYKAATGFTGTLSFTYKAKNSKGSSSLAYVYITIS